MTKKQFALDVPCVQVCQTVFRQFPAFVYLGTFFNWKAIVPKPESLGVD